MEIRSAQTAVGVAVGGGARTDLHGAVAGLEAVAHRVVTATRAVAVDAAGAERAVTGLALADAALTAARARVVAAAEDAAVPAAEGFASTGAWIADRMGLTGRGGAAEAAFLRTLVGMADVMSALEDGRISREHAAGVVAGVQRQQAEAEALAAQAAEEEAARRRQQELEDARALQAAADAAERARLAKLNAEAEAERRRAAEEAEARAREDAAQEAERRQQELLASAANGATPEQVRREGRRLADTDAARARDEAAQRSRRALTMWVDRTTGMGKLVWDMPRETWEQLQAGVAAATAPDPAETPEELRRTASQRRSDALADLLGLALSHHDRPTRGGEVPTLTVQIPAGALLDLPQLGGHGEPGIAGHGGERSAEAIRRLGCEAAIVRTITSGTATVLEAGRSTRVWSTVQRRIIEQRDGGCRFGDCERPVSFCQIHHIRWWRNGGQTDVANGALLCGWHHNAVHHDGWTLHLDPVTGIATVTKGSRTLTSRPAMRRLEVGPNDPPSSREPGGHATATATPDDEMWQRSGSRMATPPPRPRSARLPH